MYKKEDINAYFDANTDEKYREFHKKLVPNVADFRGVRLPIIKKLAKDIVRSDCRDYLENMSYDTYEERMLCALVIGHIKSDFITLEPYIRSFVPHIDNWAVCDCFCASLKITIKYKDEMFPLIMEFLHSSEEYKVRFGVVMLMDYYIDDEHIDELLRLYDEVKHEAYYVKMAVAWALSFCFIKQRDKTLQYLKRNHLDGWTFNKTISKITESYRVADSDKILVRSMKR